MSAPVLSSASSPMHVDYQGKGVTFTGQFKKYDSVKIRLTEDGPVFLLGDKAFLAEPKGSKDHAASWANLIHTPDLREHLTSRQKENTIDLSKTRAMPPFVNGQMVTGIGVVYWRSVSWRIAEAEAGAGAATPKEFNPLDNSLENPLFRSAVNGMKPAGIGYHIVSDLRNHPECFVKAFMIEHIAALGEARVRNDVPTAGVTPRDILEPELTYLVSREGKVVAVGLASDTTAAAWEKADRIYLPETKTYPGCVSLSADFVVIEDGDPLNHIDISMSIERQGQVVFHEHTNTSQVYRPFQDFVDASMRIGQPERGMIISGGTGIIPDEHIGILAGDVVKISSQRLGIEMPCAVKNVDWGKWAYRPVAK